MPTLTTPAQVPAPSAVLPILPTLHPKLLAQKADPDVQTVMTPMPGKYRVKVIRSKCIAAGSCVAIAPTVFEMDDQNIAKVISQDELDDIKLLAAQSCPTMAIVVEDIETGEQVWPQV